MIIARKKMLGVIDLRLLLSKLYYYSLGEKLLTYILNLPIK